MITGKNNTNYKKGEIILVPFPFTDLTELKTRPAVVLSTENYQNETNNLIVAMITSLSYSKSYDYKIKDWKKANLLKPSFVRAKLATLDPKLICYKPGKLSNTDLIGVEKIIKLAMKL